MVRPGDFDTTSLTQGRDFDAKVQSEGGDFDIGFKCSLLTGNFDIKEASFNCSAFLLRTSFMKVWF